MRMTALTFIETALSALERSLHERGSDLRNVQLATLSPQGRPGLRTLVLRGFERSPASAEMHTDARAAKARDIAHAGQVTLLAWSSADQLQIRLDGDARLHRDDDVARARWEGLSPNARNSYGLRADPGSRVAAPPPRSGWRAAPGAPGAAPDDRSHLPPEQQFLQFAVILVSLSGIDVLRLGPEGSQTRACGRFTASGIDARWSGP